MGTVIRSGKQMCNIMTSFLNVHTDKIIVELGAGDGVITQHILNKMAPDATLLVFEINPELCQVISKIKDHRMILINDGAQNMEFHLHKNGIGHIDCIISAIPFVMLPDSLTNEILLLSKNLLKKDGVFIQMHYVRTIQKMYKGIFGNVHISYVPLNIPPGYVFRCIKQAI